MSHLLLDPNTRVSCSGLEADTIGELIDEVDDILAALESGSPSAAGYGALISCLDAINNGRNIPTTPDCEHGGSTPSDGDNDVSGDGVSLLGKAVPNPFTGSMSYGYEVVGQDQPVDIGVYNVAGRLVKSLARGAMPAGRHTAAWDGTDGSGDRVPSGVYFVRVRLGVEVQQHRVIFLGR